MKKWLNRSCLAVLFAALFFVLGAQAVYADGTYGDFKYSQDNNTKEIKITAYTGSAANLVIPAQINGYYVTSIEYRAFSEKTSLVNVSFEAGSRLVSIGSHSFEGCTSLRKITFPDTLRSFESGSFLNCTSLETVSIPEGVTALNRYVSLDQGIFNGCTSLSSVKLPSTLTTIGQHDFENCTSLQSISLPAGLKDIGSASFRGSGLTSISIPEGVTKLHYACFENCKSLKTVDMSANVTELDDHAFLNCTSLQSVKIPLDLQWVGSRCFEGCTALTTLKFGDAFTNTYNIDYNAFANCPNLTVELARGNALETYCMNNDVKFHAYATSMGGCSVEGIEDKTYTGSPLTQTLDISCGADKLILNNDYTTEYVSNINAGTATVKIKGIGNYVGRIEKTFRINRAEMEGCKIKLSKTSMTYTSEYLTPSVKVTFRGKKVSEGDYYVSYSSNRYVGTATVTVSGRNNFQNSKKTTFKIVPKTAAIKRVKGGAKSFTVTWKQNNIQTTGYQIQYALNKKFTSGVKSVKVKDYRTTSTTVKKLKAKKTYYVRLRTYREIYGKTYYSTWSKVKSVKTK